MKEIDIFDFDKTIVPFDSGSLFWMYCLLHNPWIVICVPYILVMEIPFLLGFKDLTYAKKYLFCYVRMINLEKNVKKFWDKHEKQIKPFYREIQKEDDLIITASPKFQMDEICKRLGIKHYLASEFDLRTGEFGRPCFRERKIEFFRESYPDGVIDDFYTDSLNDEFLFPYAKRVFFVKGNKIKRIK